MKSGEAGKIGSAEEGKKGRGDVWKKGIHTAHENSPSRSWKWVNPHAFTGPIFLASLLPIFLACASDRDIRRAERNYDAESYDAAQRGYQLALEQTKPGTLREARIRYNLGTSFYKGDQTRVATAELLQAAEHPTAKRDRGEKAFRFAALYNLGNAFFKERDYDRSVMAYREALKIEPLDRDAKHNLELALEQQQQASAEGGSPRPDTANPTPQPGDGEQVPLPQQAAGLSADEAKRLLEMLGSDDARLQRERVRNLLPPKYNVDKDW